MFSKVDYVMVNVSDMHRSVAFYRDILGLRRKFESPGWSEFDTGGTTLALHPGAPATSGEAAAQSGPVAGPCSLGFLGATAEQHLCPVARPPGAFRDAAD